MQEKWEIDDSVIRICRNRKNWLGSYYELGLEFDSATFDEQMRFHLLQAVWQDLPLLGIVEERNMFGQPWRSIDVALGNKPYYQCYGCIRLKNGRIVGCGSRFFQDGNDLWFVLYIPLGMLGLVYSVDYMQPITHEGNPWTIKVDEVLAPIGMRIYREVPFKLGVLGEEASVIPLEKLIARLANDSTLLIPETFFKLMGVAPHGLRSPEGLWWTGGSEKLKGD